MLAALGTAGLAAAADDCVAGGFYQVCLLDDHAAGGATAYGSWSSWSNRPARLDASTPLGPASAGAEQYSNAEYVCAWPCFSRAADGTVAHAAAGTGATRASATAAQGTTESWYEGWGTTRTSSTAATVALGPTVLAAGQYGTGSGAGSTCTNRVSLGSATLAQAPCQLGYVDATLPQLVRTCVPTPAGPVCGRLPDYPDGTGLPFL